MRLQFRLLQNERLNCSECTEIMEFGDNVYIVPDKDVVLFLCEMCHTVKVDEDRIALLAGNGADGWSCRVADWRVAMGIDWMTREEIKQAIPPKYTGYIGQYLLGVLRRLESENEASDTGIFEKPTPL